MSENSEKIIEKIKKLLALAASPNEAEAKLAFEKAQKLIADYCVDLKQENKAETIEEIEYIPSFRNLQMEQSLPYIAQTIGSLFGVYVVVLRKEMRVKLVGFPTNIKVAAHAIDCVLNQAAIDYKIGYRKTRSVSYGAAFWPSFSDALQTRFSSSKSDSYAVTIYDPVKKYMEKFKASIFKGDLSDSIAGKNAGINSGNTVSIRPGVSVSNGGKLLS